MKYLLDTNICIHYFNGNQRLREKIISIGMEYFSISEITLAELYFGAENSKCKEQNIQRIDHFANNISIIPIYESIRTFAKEKARLRKTGITVSDFDLLIGSTAISTNRIIVTRNVKDFINLQDIQIENWIDE